MTETNAPKTQGRVLPLGDFEKCLKFVLSDAIEGGYVDNPNDPGGPTNHGISLAEVKRLDGSKRLSAYMRARLDKDASNDFTDADAKRWTIEDARAFYREYYWSVIQGDKLPAFLALTTFDAAVNEGVPVAVMRLQRFLGVKADGIVGEATISAARNVAEWNDDLKGVTATLAASRLSRARDLKNADTFFSGWARRIVMLSIEASEGL